MIMVANCGHDTFIIERTCEVVPDDLRYVLITQPLSRQYALDGNMLHSLVHLCHANQAVLWCCNKRVIHVPRHKLLGKIKLERPDQ